MTEDSKWALRCRICRPHPTNDYHQVGESSHFRRMNQELRQRVRPRNGESSANEGYEASTFERGDDATVDANNNGTNITRQQGIIRWLSINLHVLALFTVIFGFVLRISFHSGVECEMTYSMRHFVELTKHVPEHPVYRLFKFTDLRDARQSQLHSTNEEKHKEWSTSTSSEWCTLPRNDTTTIVLYIPGHWGSFSQARSLGAHGLQWTRQREQVQHQVNLLRNGQWNGSSAELSSFVYDVYAIDFAEQGGALHANFLYAQSNYVAQVIMALVNHCNNHNILLVGHSMGGLVVKSVPLLHPETRPYIHHLITLATPHNALPYSFDASLRHFYTLIKQPNPYLSTLSISGGMRDEMMPPEACHIVDSDDDYHMSVLASDIAEPPSREHMGMDHRAIVWCHNVLTRVRQILHVVATQNDPQERRRTLDSLLSSQDYDEALKAQRESFRQQLGLLKSTAMESAMLYHAELLLGLYAITAGVYHAVPTIPVAVVPLIVCAFGCMFSGVNVLVVLVLSFVANAIHALAAFSLTWVASRQRVTKQRSATAVAKRHFLLFVFSTFLVQVGALAFGYQRTHSIVFLDLLPAVFVAIVFCLPVVVVLLLEPSSVTFASLLLPIWPFLVIGKLFLIAWSIVEDFESTGVLEFLLVVCFPVYLQMVLSYRAPNRQSWILSCAYLVMVAMFAAIPQTSMLRAGRGYVVAYYLSTTAWLDLLVAILAR